MNNVEIILVNPPLRLEDRYGNLANAGGVEPPFGLCYLAGMARRQGYKVHIVDAQALDIGQRETLEKILSYYPKYVGFTACTSQINSASYLAKSLKMVSSEIITILGGPHLSALPQETMWAYPEFDIGVIGEGEQTLCDILSAHKHGGDLCSVNGLIIRKAGNLCLTGPRPLIGDLDQLAPPAFDLLPDLVKFYRIPIQSVDRYPAVSLVTSRGCPGQCTFCDRSVFGNYFRYHSAQFMMNLIRELSKKYGVKSILFEDDNFLLFRQRLFELMDMMRKERLDLSWSCLARVDMVDEQILREAKSAGCWQILYGIESGSQPILDFFKKGITLEQVENTVNITSRAGINTKGFLMFGNPLETKETLEATIDFIRRIKLDDVSITFFTPYPGSTIYNSIEKYGRINKDWAKMTCFELVFTPSGLNKVYLEKMLKRAYRTFYLRPKIVISRLKKMKNLKIFLGYLSATISFIFFIFRKKICCAKETISEDNYN